MRVLDAETRLMELVREYLHSEEIAIQADRVGIMDCVLTIERGMVPDDERLADLARSFVHAYETEDLSELPAALAAHVVKYLPVNA